MRSVKKVTIFLLGLVTVFALTGSVLAFDASKTGLRTTADKAGLLKINADQDLPTIVGNVIGTGLSFVSVLFFLIMLYGGILWMTARGNDDQTKKALGTIIAATVGIIIILASYALTNFVFGSIAAQKVVESGGDAAEEEAAEAGAALVAGVCADQVDFDSCGNTQEDGVQCEWDGVVDACVKL